jgi:hypothetical protein
MVLGGLEADGFDQFIRIVSHPLTMVIELRAPPVSKSPFAKEN